MVMTRTDAPEGDRISVVNDRLVENSSGLRVIIIRTRVVFGHAQMG